MDFFRARPEAAVGSAVVAVVVLFALVGPLAWTVNPLHVSLDTSLQGPSGGHPFGTDEIGRDLLARVMAAGRLDVLVAALVTLAGGLVGMGIGIFAGVLGGATDNVWMRLMDALLAFPPLVLALGIAVGLGAGTVAAAIGITAATVPYYARLMRAEVLRVKALPFVEAATVSGCRRVKLVRRHVLPHTWRVLGVQASSSVGYTVLTLAALGFVGLGVQSPTPEWGTMISEDLSYMPSGDWWIGVFPGILLLLLVTGCNLIADGFGTETRLRWSRPSFRLREAK